MKRLHPLECFGVALILTISLALITFLTVSCTPASADEINSLMERSAFNTTVIKEPLTQWDISNVTTDTHHYGCEAKRDFGSGTALTVRLPADPKASSIDITLSGVNFGMLAPEYGLWQVDDLDPVEIFGKATTAWTTDMQISTDFTKAETLKQFAGGRKLKLVFNKQFFELDLKETSAMLRALRKCNEVGQNMLNRKRVDAAMKASTRSA